MRTFFFSLMLIATIVSFGQDKKLIDIANSVSQEQLKKNLYFLASDQMEGRLMGSRGDSMASAFIVDWFRNNGVNPAYKTGYYQAIQVYRKKFNSSEITIGNKKYELQNGWTAALRSAETTQLKNLPIVFAGYGIETDNYNDFAGIDVKGKAVLLLSGQPRDTGGKYLLSGTSRPAQVTAAATLLKQKGAVLIIQYNPRFTQDTTLQRRSGEQSVYKSGLPSTPSVPSITVSADGANAILASDGKTITDLEQNILAGFQPTSFDLKNNISVDLKVDLTEEKAPNVIGVIEGSDPNAGYVILSAHHDHVGIMRNQIYYGAVDNASGTVALMEVAALLNKAVQSGARPKRTVVFASFTGEEKGLLGSSYFAEHPVYPIEKAHAIMNIDMMGRVDTFYSGRRADSNYAYILVQDTLSRGLRNSLLSANEKLGKLKLDTYYEQPQNRQRRLTGSDQYPFYLKGVPFLRIDCGFSKDYHQATDTPDKINYPLLSDQVQLAFLTIWNIASQ